MENSERSLLADIGATWSRFALTSRDRLAQGEIRFERQARFRCDDYADLESVIEAYLETLSGLHVTSACIAIAGPVDAGRVFMPNRGWSASIEDLSQRLGFAHLAMINDAAAGALATSRLGEGDLAVVRKGIARQDHPRLNIVPGTGLGVGAAVRVGGRWHPLPGEGGHIAMGARAAEEYAVLRALASAQGAAIPDNTLSGPGMLNLYRALAEVRGEPARDFSPAEMTDCALSGRDGLCRDALDMYCLLLGRLAGDLALVISAHGGVYLAGSLMRHLGAERVAEPFDRGFADKGAMSDKVSDIPAYLVRLESPGLYGAAVWLLSQQSEAAR